MRDALLTTIAAREQHFSQQGRPFDGPGGTPFPWEDGRSRQPPYAVKRKRAQQTGLAPRSMV